MNSKDFLKEGFIEDASDVHMDHEVQMAREECYHAAEHALAIHKLLRNISEQQGLEGWVSSKITLANDYLNTVREHLEYELLQPQIDDAALGMPIAENQRLDELNPINVATAAGAAVGGASIAALRKLDQKRKEQQAQTQSKQDKDSNEKLERERERELQQNLHQHQLLNQPVNEQGVAEGLEKVHLKTPKHGLADHPGRNTGVGLAAFAKTPETNRCPKCNSLYKNHYKQGVAEGSDVEYIVVIRDEQGKRSIRVSALTPTDAKEKAEARGYKVLKVKDPREANYFREQGVAEDLEDKTAQQRKIERDKQRTAPAQKARNQAQRRGLQQDKDGTYYAKEGVAEDTKCNHTMEGAKCPVHGLRECPMRESLSDEQRAEHERQLSDFVRGGGQIERLRAQKGPRRSGASLGSKHIGGRSDAQSGKRSQTRGLGSSPTGKLLVAKEDMNAWKKQQRALMRETSAGSVAGVVNPKSKKPKSQVGSLFGGTYKQPQKKA